MKKSTIYTTALFVCFLLQFSEIFAQNPCGTKPYTTAQRNAVIRNRRAFEQLRTTADSAKKTTDTTKIAATPDDGVTFFPVLAHIARKNKLGAFPLGELNNSIAVTNRHFRSAGKGIQFYLAGSLPDYIDDSTFFDYASSKKDSLGRTHEQLVTSKYGVKNAINIYFMNSVKSDGVDVGGYAYFPDIADYSNHVFMVTGQSNDNITLPHELGHYFQLAHTFDSSADPDTTQRELVTRLKTETKPRRVANCDAKGDLHCDTPADPYDRIKSTFSGCTYNLPASKMADANGDGFAPQMNNIMAYFQCGTFIFTGSQLALMGGAALQARLSKSNTYVVNGAKAYQPTIVKAPVLRKPKLNNPGGVTIAWADSSKNEAGFLIERATAKLGPFFGIAGVQPNDTTFIDRNIVANQKYYYRLKPSNTTTAAYSKIDSVKIDSLQICASLYAVSCSTSDGIQDFVLNGESKISNLKSGCSANNFGDYSKLSANVKAGKKYAFGVSTKTDTTGTFFRQSVSIWIDLNKDGVFSGSKRDSLKNSDSLEIVYQGKMTVGNSSISDSISIPKFLKNGTYRMRVRSQRVSGGLVTSPCDLYTYGETEDYSLVITSADAQARIGEIIEQTKQEVFETGVYPNPSDGQEFFVKVAGNAQNALISLYNSTGQDVSFRQKIVDTNTLLIKPSQKLSTGIYIIKSQVDGKTKSHKVVIE